MDSRTQQEKVVRTVSGVDGETMINALRVGLDVAGRVLLLADVGGGPVIIASLSPNRAGRLSIALGRAAHYADRGHDIGELQEVSKSTPADIEDAARLAGVRRG